MSRIADVTELYKPKKGTDLELKSCPFCGNEEIVYGKYTIKCGEDRWLVFCTNCLAEIDPGWAQQRCDVHDMWNKRTGKEMKA